MASPRKILILVFIVLASAMFSKTALCQDAENVPQKTPSTKQELADSLMLRVEPFKKNMSEITLFGGDYLGDKWGNSWDVGGMYTFHFNDTLGIAANYTYSIIYGDKSSDFRKGLGKRDVHSAFVAAVLNNDTALRVGSSIMNCDLFATIGGGSIQINDIWKYLIVVGGGIRVYTPIPWLAIRFDINSYMHPTPGPGGSGFNADMVMNLGMSFMIPPRKL